MLTLIKFKLTEKFFLDLYVLSIKKIKPYFFQEYFIVVFNLLNKYYVWDNMVERLRKDLKNRKRNDEI